MKLSDFKTMKKMMNMTQSGSDQEKLTAVGMVNAILRKSNTTWDRVLDRCISVEVGVESVEAATGRRGEGPTADERAAARRRIVDAFAAIEASDPRGERATFVDSLRRQWDERGRLTPAQLEALFGIEKKVEERG